MPQTKTAAYGSWKSPITSDLIVAQSTTLSDVRLAGDDIYWLEGRPQEQGRNVIVRNGPDGAPTDITPAAFNARTRVHEYGGASWLVADRLCIFSNFADQRLYRQHTSESVPAPLTPVPLSPKHHLRYSDGVLDERRRRWIGVLEDHTGEGEPVNAIVAINLDEPGTSPGRVLAGGHDFFCSPRLSPDATRMVWLAWDHSNMPWNGTTLYLADIGVDGAPADIRVIAGGVTESVFQPEWSPDGNEIIFVSDRSGWWNLYAFEAATGMTRPLCPMQADCVTLFDFDTSSTHIDVECIIRLEHTPENAPDFQIDEYAKLHPFEYHAKQMPDLSSCIRRQCLDPEGDVRKWLRGFLKIGRKQPTGRLLMTLNEAIADGFSYVRRSAPGTQTPVETLKSQKGTCRDFALLMMEAARSLGFAARFVTGYIYVPQRDGPGWLGGGSTHAWCQIYLPGSGWVEFDPTNGIVGNRDLIRVAVARNPDQAIPLSGVYYGDRCDELGMEVEVNVKSEATSAQ